MAEEKICWSMYCFAHLVGEYADRFEEWWYEPIFNWEDLSTVLAYSCYEHFDIWWDPIKFNWDSAYDYLVQNCASRFTIDQLIELLDHENELARKFAVNELKNRKISLKEKLETKNRDNKKIIYVNDNDDPIKMAKRLSQLIGNKNEPVELDMTIGPGYPSKYILKFKDDPKFELWFTESTKITVYDNGDIETKDSELVNTYKRINSEYQIQKFDKCCATCANSYVSIGPKDELFCTTVDSKSIRTSVDPYGICDKYRKSNRCNDKSKKE